MNQGKLEVVKQDMARVNINILGISERKWTGMVSGFYDTLLGGWLNNKRQLASFTSRVHDVLASAELHGTVFCKNFKRKDQMVSFRTSQLLKPGILETDICVAS